MKEHAIQGELREWAKNALKQSPLFSSLHIGDIEIVLSYSKVVEYTPQEELFREGETPTAFYMLLSGEASVWMNRPELNYQIELHQLSSLDLAGDISLMTGKPRFVTVVAASRLYVLQFDFNAFDLMMTKLHGFALQFSRNLGERLARVMQDLSPSLMDVADVGQIPADVLQLFPTAMLNRHRFVPVFLKDNMLKLCMVDLPDHHQLGAIREFRQGLRLQVYRISPHDFEIVLKKHGLFDPSLSSSSGSLEQSGALASVVGRSLSSDALPAHASQTQLAGLAMAGLLPGDRQGKMAMANRFEVRELTPEQKRERLGKILPLMKEMAKRNASDLHLSANQKMRWRIDGDLLEITESKELGRNEVFELLEPMMPERSRLEFEDKSHTDFSYTLEGIARYRVNIYREDNGVSAALRQIPIGIPSAKELRLPQIIRNMANFQQGLVLVTGPTGSGKSTTLASILNSINEKNKKHIITLEDPIEFVHRSQKCLVHQREIGTHVGGFDEALRAALREDPDIILVGEMRDLETMALAIETAHTGHLVFGTLHTNNVISTIDRIIDMFPAEQQSQVRSSLSDTLKGVICQSLCKKMGGARVAAFEVLTMNSAIANMVRSGKTHQMASSMIGKGNLLLNSHLEELVKTNLIDAREALYRSVDKEDMRGRLGPRLQAALRKLGRTSGGDTMG